MLIILTLAGHRILARRYKTKAGEIDLITKRGGTIAMVEVKARQTIDDAIYAVTPANRRRIEAAGRSFIARYPRYAHCAVRYDICAVAPWGFRWVKQAWG